MYSPTTITTINTSIQLHSTTTTTQSSSNYGVCVCEYYIQNYKPACIQAAAAVMCSTYAWASFQECSLLLLLASQAATTATTAPPKGSREDGEGDHQEGEGEFGAAVVLCVVE